MIIKYININQHDAVEEAKDRPIGLLSLLFNLFIRVF